MFRGPVARIAQGIDVLPEVDAVAQRRRGRGVGGDEREVENGEVGHGRKLAGVLSSTRWRNTLLGFEDRHDRGTESV